MDPNESSSSEEIEIVYEPKEGTEITSLEMGLACLAKYAYKGDSFFLDGIETDEKRTKERDLIEGGALRLDDECARRISQHGGEPPRVAGLLPREAVQDSGAVERCADGPAGCVAVRPRHRAQRRLHLDDLCLG